MLKDFQFYFLKGNILCISNCCISVTYFHFFIVLHYIVIQNNKMVMWSINSGKYAIMLHCELDFGGRNVTVTVEKLCL